MREPWPFKFNLEKATQAVGVILREEPGHKMPIRKLLALLYIAKRESLAETGTMITGDRIVAVSEELINKSGRGLRP
jgi:hypothetical protein